MQTVSYFYFINAISVNIVKNNVLQKLSHRILFQPKSIYLYHF
jgi:hypothetical protein